MPVRRLPSRRGACQYHVARQTDPLAAIFHVRQLCDRLGTRLIRPQAHEARRHQVHVVALSVMRHPIREQLVLGPAQGVELDQRDRIGVGVFRPRAY